MTLLHLLGSVLALLVLLCDFGDGESCTSKQDQQKKRQKNRKEGSGVGKWVNEKKSRIESREEHIPGGSDCLSFSAFSESLRTSVYR